MDMPGMVIKARSGVLSLASGDALFDFPRENPDKQTVKYFWQSVQDE